MVCAPAASRSGIRCSANRWVSTEVPNQTVDGHSPGAHGTIAGTFSGRFVSSCHRSHGVSAMTFHSRARAASSWALISGSG